MPWPARPGAGSSGLCAASGPPHPSRVRCNDNPGPPTAAAQVSLQGSLQPGSAGGLRCAGGRSTVVLFPVRGQFPAPNERRDGRSPGLPICALGRLPGDPSSGLLAASSWLTVAGSAPDSHRVPYLPPVGRHHLRALSKQRLQSVKRRRASADRWPVTGRRRRQKSMPRTALMPASKGCFTARISLTRSA